jgi:hypothetical protein
MSSPRLTDVEMEMMARQKKENRRAIIALIGLVGGLSGLAVFLASMSRAGHEEDRAVSERSSHKDAPATKDVKPAVADSTPANHTVAPVPAPPPPAPPASADDVRRLVREQKQSSVMACIAQAGKKVAQKEKVTVKMDLKTPDRIAKLEVTATPKSPKIVSCVKSELKGFAVPKLASSMTVSVPFKLETAHGRRAVR